MKTKILSFLLPILAVVFISCKKTRIFGVDQASAVFQIDSVTVAGPQFLDVEVVNFPLDSIAQSLGMKSESLKELKLEYLHLQALDGQNFNDFNSASVHFQSASFPETALGNIPAIAEWSDYLVTEINKEQNLVELVRSDNSFQIKLFADIKSPRDTPLRIKALMRFKVVMQQ